eukprot:TRINITY_DN49987_c0_g1_i1.p1 TRINITY_DN49987_c0_g1~~TRINITY_DN49987_c0_g1_i1.p1  ORF type:complete len:238 (+),score=63.54 TRINITY_DN49987_c0_g1_i1:45-758(+)
MGKGNMKGFTSKGKSTSSSVSKPWLKKTSTAGGGKGNVSTYSKGGPIAAWSSNGGQRASSKVGFKVGGKVYSGDGDGWAGKGAKSTGKSIVTSSSKAGGKSQSKGKSGRKGKGKGKRNRAAPLDSAFWEKKVESENRVQVGEKTYTGTITRYSFKQGWGFLLPDNPAGMPKQVKAALEEAAVAAEEAGKEVDPNEVYFRKPDVNHEDGFKLRADVNVTFSVYIDDKGAGAFDVTMAE